jgi:hypothetical protein
MTKQQARAIGFDLRWDHTGRIVQRGCCYFYSIPHKERWIGAIFATEAEAFEWLERLLDAEAARTWKETLG